jgi:hypothetical protein
MYILSCRNCSVEYLFRRRKPLRDFGNCCPRCGGHLSSVPLPRYTLTPPPDMRKVEAKVERVKTWKVRREVS